MAKKKKKVEEKRMEVSVGDYGRMIFEMTIGDGYAGRRDDLPVHWASIFDKAEPLVRQLLALNEEMVGETGKGYKITGYIKEGGKKVRPDHERIQMAQEALWKVKASTLKEGDLIWLLDSDHEMYIGENPPVSVQDVSKKCVYVEMQGCNYEYTVQVDLGDDVLNAPDDWDGEGWEQSQKYGDDYWLAKADELGI